MDYVILKNTAGRDKFSNICEFVVASGVAKSALGNCSYPSVQIIFLI
jgi:hypothetical protein